MSAAKFDIVIEKGADFSLPLRVKFEDGRSRDFSGYTARMHVRELPYADEIIDELTTENKRITICSENGGLEPVKDWIVMNWPSTVSSGIATGNHYYDLEIVSPEGIVERLMDGRIRAVEEVTR